MHIKINIYSLAKIKSVEIFICNLFGVTLLVFYLILVVVHISNLKIHTITNVTVLVKQKNLNSHTWVLFLFLKQQSLSQYGKAKISQYSYFYRKSCRRRIIRVSVQTISVEKWLESLGLLTQSGNHPSWQIIRRILGVRELSESENNRSWRIIGVWELLQSKNYQLENYPSQQIIVA